MGLKRNGCLIQFASEELKSNRKLAEIAVKTHGSCLRWFSSEIKQDRTLVMEALKNDKCFDCFRYVIKY